MTVVGDQPEGGFDEIARINAGELLADRYVHYAGLVAGLTGAIAIVIAAAERGSWLAFGAVAIYGIGLISMIGASALYNLAKPSPRKEVFRRLDHAAIFVMIAGTYTPLTLICIRGASGVGIALLVWGVASVGIALKMIYPRRFERLSILLYLALGWIILLWARALLDAASTSVVVLLGVGGLLYTLGLVFHLRRTWPYHNAIWHGFVLCAAACHWVAIFKSVVQAPA